LLSVHLLNLLFHDANGLVEPVLVTTQPLDLNGRKPLSRSDILQPLIGKASLVLWCLADLTKVIELNPDFSAAYINRGVAKRCIKI
jgi:hypothetical protein